MILNEIAAIKLDLNHLAQSQQIKITTKCKYYGLSELAAQTRMITEGQLQIMTGHKVDC